MLPVVDSGEIPVMVAETKITEYINCAETPVSFVSSGTRGYNVGSTTLIALENTLISPAESDSTGAIKIFGRCPEIRPARSSTNPASLPTPISMETPPSITSVVHGT